MEFYFGFILLHFWIFEKSKLLNLIDSTSINMKLVSIRSNLNIFKKMENCSLCLKGCKNIGCEIDNIIANDLTQEKVFFFSLKENIYIYRQYQYWNYYGN